MKKYILLLAILSFSAQSSCDLPPNNDYLRLILSRSGECPLDVKSLKKEFELDGMTAVPAMVANRGFHNPEEGSFSIFESVKGFSRLRGAAVAPEHLYFGHFTGLESKKIVLDQTATPQKLLIEAIAYDFKKEIYNFYELRGTLSGARWFYRGDSWDALKDNVNLKRGPSPRFGSRMRCSACHNSGGPIMKEINFPHSDWWTKSRGLPLGSNSPSQDIDVYLKQFVDASVFAQNVQKGINLLKKKQMEGTLTNQEKLRPLFCSTEINLKSDSGLNSQVEISSEVFVDPFLVEERVLTMDRSAYLNGLKFLKSKFPENGQLDAAFAFHAPVRSVVNQIQVRELISLGFISQEFALDVLIIDYKNPLFSKTRCDLLKLVPEGSGWQEGFIKNLSSELSSNFKIQNGDEHKKKAAQYIEDKKLSWNSSQKVIEELQKLNVLRLSVYQDEISQNPQGQILEPGFRVIFPEF